MFFKIKDIPSQFMFLAGTIFEHNFSCNEKLFEHFFEKAYIFIRGLDFRC